MSLRPALLRSAAFLRPVRTSTSAFSTSPIPRALIPFTLTAHGTGVAQTLCIVGSPHRINTDAYAAFGGSDSAPSPLHFNLTALSSCSQVTGSVVAKDHGLTLGKWEVEVTGQLDPAVLAEGKPDNGNGGNWNSVDLKVRVGVQGRGSKGSEEEAFEYWVAEVERRCPVTQLFKRSGVKWTSKWERS